MSNIKNTDLFLDIPYELEPLFSEHQYPWQMLPHIKELLEGLTKTGIKGYTRYKNNILIGEGARISDRATLIGPLIIGKGAEIRAGALIRGTVYIGEGCVVGNSSEIKCSVLLRGAQIPHYNYVGNSILGTLSHLGAGAVISNLRLDKANVKIKLSTPIQTDQRKVGAFIGDGCEIGCGSVICPGSVLGRECFVHPLTLVNGVYPEKSVIKK